MSNERQGLNDRVEKALAILSGTPISFSYQDADLRYVWFENAPAEWAVDEATGGGDADLFPVSSAASLAAAKAEVVGNAVSRKAELTLDHPEGQRFYDIFLQPDCDASGKVVGVLSSIVDVSDRRRSEAIRETLLREVTHRSKNLLAIVMSLAAQTSRTARTVDDFLDRFNGRVQSMSRSQDLITEANWRGAQLSELIATQVESFAARGRQQVGLDGRDYYLKPNAALYVGLALHELAVNSVQTGALATPNGRVSVAVMALPGFNDQTNPTAPALSLTWSETGEGPIEEPDREEFGHVLLSRLVPLAVGGTSELSGGPDGLRYALTLQRREIE